ncbi:MAG: hypothetical protein AVDCRST_MAG57-1820 [uncultured Blastococcus sp.]|uniref:Uncharacterized protein n=1 Tax=uncultured Blastococcus sp. TaxID=217144 RepID=A0A6J4ICN0_9ACTN|nr:MAG: hypothetical protein AVDCRST_MAG57-1820 [uncultured Blastococcus sp.]
MSLERWPSVDDASSPRPRNDEASINLLVAQLLVGAGFAMSAAVQAGRK